MSQDIHVKEAAELLNVSEKTIYRWIRQGVIPTIKLQGQYRFDRAELQGWARHNRIGSTLAGDAADASEEDAPLLGAVELGGIHYRIEGDTPEAIYAQVAALIPFSPRVAATYRETLRATLLEREALVSTGIGHGIALPHPRHPRDWGLGRPAVAIFFLDHPVDFHALDGEPVFVLFVILCGTVKGHLKMLSRVSHLVRAPETRAFLRGTPNRTDLMERIRDAFAAQS
jgi:nitrogen PTS system EIIA component